MLSICDFIFLNPLPLLKSGGVCPQGLMVALWENFKSEWLAYTIKMVACGDAGVPV